MGEEEEGVMSREQLISLFHRFSLRISLPQVKKRIADAVFHDNQEAVAVTTAIQEEILLELGIECCGDKTNIVNASKCHTLIDSLIASVDFFDGSSSCIENPSVTMFEILIKLLDFEALPAIGCAEDPRVGLPYLGKVNTVFENDQELMVQFYRFIMKEEIACEEAELGPDLFAEKMEMQHNLQKSQLEMLEHMRKFHLDDQSAILEKLHQQLEEANFDSEASVLTVEQVQDIVRRRVTPVYSPK